jgi:transposase
MRQTHPGGDKLFVDYAGQTVPVVDPVTARSAAPRSSWPCWARRTTPTPAPPGQQKAADWVASIIGTLEFIGGVPRLLVPDQPRALMANPDRLRAHHRTG